MVAEDLRKIPWVMVEDWSGLRESIYKKGKWYVGINDVKAFFENLCRNIARESDLPFREVKNIIEQENTPFIERTENFLCDCMCKKNNIRLQVFLKMLKIPDVNAVKFDPAFRAQKLIDYFNTLPKEKQCKVLEQLSLISITIEKLNP